MSGIRFLLDENMPHGVRTQLLYHEPAIEVLCIGDLNAPEIGTPDPDILDWIEQDECILVSRNRKTMPDHLRDHLEKGGHIPGILLLRRRISLGQLVEDLLLIWKISDSDESRDRIEYLPL